MRLQELLTCLCTGAYPDTNLEGFWSLAMRVSGSSRTGDTLHISGVPPRLWLAYYRRSPANAQRMHQSPLDFVRAIAQVEAARTAIESVAL